jgi:hypothetical protein
MLRVEQAGAASLRVGRASRHAVACRYSNNSS